MTALLSKVTTRPTALASEHLSDHQSRLANLLWDDFLAQLLGEVAEWPNVTDSKSVVLERVPGVRIPPSPPLGAAQLTIRRSWKRDENLFDGRSERDWRWGTEGGRLAMRRSLTNPSFSANLIRLACHKSVPVSS